MQNRAFTLSVTTILLLAVASLPAFAGGNKVDVCHIPPGNPDNWHTISVSSNALSAHLAHGDLEGSCLENCEALCDDADACTQDIESDLDQCLCNAEPRPSVDCDDSNPCTLDACNSEFGCTYDTAALNGTTCDDGDPTTTGDVCTDGVCAGGAACFTCADNSPCTPQNIANGDYFHPHCDETLFIQCDDWGGCFEMPCPPGTVWDDDAETCLPTGPP